MALYSHTFLLNLPPQLIIDVEQRARDTDAKCTDLLERINFMVSNITVLEKVKAIEPLVAVISKMNDTLKRAASLIQAYRKQGAIARRLNISNSQNFVQMAESISACSQDLMLSLQIQQTGDISVLTRSVPMDSQDEEAKSFVMSHGGQSAINVRSEQTRNKRIVYREKPASHTSIRYLTYHFFFF